MGFFSKLGFKQLEFADKGKPKSICMHIRDQVEIDVKAPYRILSWRERARMLSPVLFRADKMIR
jgi:hypothetical protein